MKKLYQLSVFFIFFLMTGCAKFLDEVPNQNLVIPSRLSDLQGMMDDYGNLLPDPGIGEISADDYYLTNADWASLTEEGHRRTYLWEKDYLFGTGSSTDWLTAYRIIYYANIVLENIVKIEQNALNQAEWNNIKGQAAFLRGRSLLGATQVWTKAYDQSTAAADLGMPIRLSSDFNVPSVRSNLKETYERIIADLKEAATLLPIQPVHVTRPSQPAAFGLLARTYLFMGDYEKCLYYSDQFLNLKNELLDFNTLSPSATFPVPEFNKEVIYGSYILTPAPLNIVRAKVDSSLYNSYVTDDLRKTIFFRNNNNMTYGFKGSYRGNLSPFSGVATNEVYLMRAECYARLGNTNAALSDLNTLLKTRWRKSVPYKPYVATNADEALKLILVERRKELLIRGLRWPDIKRLNKLGAGITLFRVINNKLYTLPANDLRYALPIPEDIIALTGMQQNPR